MKPKHYIDKYYNAKYKSFQSNDDFYNDLMNDFANELAKGKGKENLKGFENSVRVLRMKWDGIMSKSGGALSEKAWGYFFAKYIAPLREQLFSEQLEQRRKKAEERRKFWRDYNQFEQDMFSSFWRDFLFSSFINNIRQELGQVKAAFVRLDLDFNKRSEYTVNTVKKAYAKLAYKYHPDVGGESANAEMFDLVTKSKNIILQFINDSN